MEEKERLKKHLEYLCSFDKLTGEPEALQAVAYISDVLKKYGVSCHTETFPAYLSNPVKSVLTVDGKEIPSRPRSFSESTGKSLHVPWNQRSSFYGQTEAVFRKCFRKAGVGIWL